MISYSTILHYYLPTRCLLKFEYQLPHPILRTTLATDKKWPLSHSHISYQNSEISWPKMGLILVNKCQFQKKVLLKWYSSMKKPFRKFWIIFYIETWLWKSEIGTFDWLNGHFLSVAKAGLRIGCGSWNSNLKSHLLSLLVYRASK